jgi:hypothetical protein
VARLFYFEQLAELEFNGPPLKTKWIELHLMLRLELEVAPQGCVAILQIDLSCQKTSK